MLGISAATPPYAQDPALPDREAMYHRYMDFASYVKGGSIEPNWMADGHSFWCAEGDPSADVVGAAEYFW